MEDDSGQQQQLIITSAPPPPPSAATSYQNLDVSNNSTRSKEEGELSSSETDQGKFYGFPFMSSSSTGPGQVLLLSKFISQDFPGGSVSQFYDCVPVQGESVQVDSAIKSTQILMTGNSALTGDPMSSTGINSRTHNQPTHRSEKNRVPFVISFSDDESGSEPEHFPEVASVAFRGNTREVDGTRRPPKSLDKSQVLRGSAGNDTRKMQGKVSLNRTFASSLNRINGTSSRNGGPLPIGLSSRVKNASSLNFNKTGENVQLNTSKLQDLRELISIRENELKIKVAKHKNEIASASYKDQTHLSVRDNAVRNRDSTGCIQFELEGPEKKRFKLIERHLNASNRDGQPDRPATELMLAPEKLVLEKFGQEGGDNRRCLDKEILSGTTRPNATQREKQQIIHNLSSGIGVSNISQCNRNTKLAESSAHVVKQTSKTSPNESLTAEVKHPVKLNYKRESGSNLNTKVPAEPTGGDSLVRSSMLQEVISSNKVAKRGPSDMGRTSSFHVPDGILEKPDVCLNPSLINSLGNINNSESGDMDIQSFLEMEELHDKELEDAQALRHQCEVEERNALKVYRKAQRALAEANARCSYLYRKRESYSAHFRSRMIEDSSLSWLTRSNSRNELGMNSLANISENDMNLLTMPGNKMQAEFDILNQHHYDLNGTDGALEKLNTVHKDGQNLASEQCSERDGSSSEQQEDYGTANCLGFVSNDINVSVDEDTFPSEVTTGKSNLDSQGKDGLPTEGTKDVNEEPNALATSEDSLLLEATLRSQLFAKLGAKTSLKRGSNKSVEPTVEREAQIGGELMERTGDLPYSEVDKDSHFKSEGNERSERNIAEQPLDSRSECHTEKFSSDYESPSRAASLKSCLVPSAPFLDPVVRSAFSNIIVPDAINSIKAQTRYLLIRSTKGSDERRNGIIADEIRPTNKISNSIESTSLDMCASKGGSYSNNLEINPFWPLCMFELRGKCNNDECAWQHVRDYSSGSVSRENSYAGDSLVESSLQSGKYRDATNLSKCTSLLPLAPPTYFVSLDTLKTDQHPSKYVLSRIVGQRWQKCFSASLVLSNVLPLDLRSDEPCLHGPEARIDVEVRWTRQSSYFHSRNGTLSQLDEHMTDNEQALDMALVTYNREVSKQNGRIEALKVLARAIEADPTSNVLWAVYLHVYYSNQKSIGKDDLFRTAVEHNEVSYELWLLYINSRVKLDDRLVAYDTALSALCRQASTSFNPAVAISQWILDLFLQMLNCLCISGELDKAIQKIYGLFPSTKKSGDPHRLFLPDIPLCLTICDKCIFWVCCVYLFVYKMLPSDIVQCFEYQKEICNVDWPSKELTVDEKQHAVTLMELAVDSLALYIDSESLETETTLRAAHFFAVNHIKCIAVIEGLECSKSLLEKYIKLYPSCLELILMSARAAENDYGYEKVTGFEEALSNWMDGVPGVQCVWNQYAECALRNQRLDFAEALLERWLHAVGQIYSPQSENPDAGIDVVFGLLNLSLLKHLQNEQTEARLAIERALKVASAKEYKHCVREHAMFLLKDDSDFREGPLLKMLNEYLTDSRALPASGSFSRKFIEGIKKPRVQQLVNNLFTPVSSNVSLVNLVLESCYGPSLLPQVSGKLADLVDFVEAVMEIAPANYQLAISVCKVLSDTRDSVAANASVFFWASSLLIDSLFQAVPVAPEYVWAEAARMLQTLTDVQAVSESFHKRALLVYPFSVNLWKSYLSLFRNTGNIDAVIGAARERGITLV